jgi:hypothetical protein
MKKIRGILIDPVAERIEYAAYDGHYTHIYKLLSDPENNLEVGTFAVVQVDEKESLYVDDNGLLKNPRYFFIWSSYPQPLAGRGLILGVNRGGSDVSTKMTLDSVRRMVRFTKLSVKGFDHYEGTTTKFGEEFHVIGSKPKFGPAEDA